MGCFVFLISYICLYICHTYMFKIIKHILILNKDNPKKYKILFKMVFSFKKLAKPTCPRVKK